MNYMSFALNYLGIAAFGILSAVNGKLANKKLESALGQMMDIKDVRNMSIQESIKFVDDIAAIMISVLPNVTYEIGRPYKVPIQGGYIYYGTNVNEKLRPGAEPSINVLVDSERDKFKDFTASTRMRGVLVTFNSKGIVTISGQTDMGTSRADVSMKLDTSTGKAFGEYSSTVNAQGKISLTTILGFEKDLDVDRPKDNGGGINWSTVVSVVSWAAIGLGGIGIVAKAVAMGSKALPALGFLGV